MICQLHPAYSFSKKNYLVAEGIVPFGSRRYVSHLIPCKFWHGAPELSKVKELLAKIRANGRSGRVALAGYCHGRQRGEKDSAYARGLTWMFPPLC